MTLRHNVKRALAERARHTNDPAGQVQQTGSLNVTTFKRPADLQLLLACVLTHQHCSTQYLQVAGAHRATALVLSNQHTVPVVAAKVVGCQHALHLWNNLLVLTALQEKVGCAFYFNHSAVNSSHNLQCSATYSRPGPKTPWALRLHAHTAA
jgi:hypothetical protein